MQSVRVRVPGHDPGLNLYAPPPKPSPLTRTSLLTRPWMSTRSFEDTFSAREGNCRVTFGAFRKRRVTSGAKV